MTKKDYELIASVIATNYLHSHLWSNEDKREGAETAVECIAEDMADMLAADNLRFDRNRFLRACGLD